MKIRLRSLRRAISLSLSLLVLLIVSQGVARADEVHLAGYTNGCFNCLNPINANGPQAATLLGLTYVNSTFSGTTVNGFRGLGGNPIPFAQNVNNLGALTLDTAPNNYFNNEFALRVTFTAPQGINGSNTRTFSALLTGTVRANDQGGVNLDFNNNPIVFTFTDTNCEPDPTGGIPGQQTTCGQGFFSFSVNDVSIDPGQTVSLTGQFTSTQLQPIPEPATLLLLGTGLTGLAGAARRRRMKRGKN